MYYASHILLADRYHNPLMTLGSIMPDLCQPIIGSTAHSLRILTRPDDINIDDIDPNTEPTFLFQYKHKHDLRWFATGITHHAAVDHAFYNSIMYSSYLEAAKRMISRQHSKPGHLHRFVTEKRFLDLCIDHFLLSTPHSCERLQSFYKAFERLKTTRITKYYDQLFATACAELRKHVSSSTPEEVKATLEQKITSLERCRSRIAAELPERIETFRKTEEPALRRVKDRYQPTSTALVEMHFIELGYTALMDVYRRDVPEIPEKAAEALLELDIDFFLEKIHYQARNALLLLRMIDEEVLKNLT